MDQVLLDSIQHQIPGLIITAELKNCGQKLVFHSKFENKVSVFKVIKSNNKENILRASREMQILTKLDSEYFPKIYKFGEIEAESKNIFYVIEEFIEGKNLRDLLNIHSSSPILMNECKRIIIALLNILEIFEPLQLVHRDIKPENIIVALNRVVLLDFGIARDMTKSSLTETFAIFGPMTIGYAPPEQVRNEKRKISFRTDLFSIGVVFYEILTNQNPFSFGVLNQSEVLNRTLNTNAASLTSFGLNQSFDDFVQKCLEKSCHRRPSSISQAKSIFNNIIWE